MLMPFRSPPLAEIHDGELHFAAITGRDELLERGICYVRAPADLDLAPCVRFCESFYRARTGLSGDEYRGFRGARFEGSVLGYSDTGSDQVERLQLELALWRQHLPRDVVPALHCMNDLARTFVRSVFAHCAVKASDVARITGGMESNDALQYCIFNNFESRKAGIDGFSPHKDSGFVQLMHITESGLEVWEDERWNAVDPVDGHLVAVTGHSLEILTVRTSTRAIAAYHRVRNIASRRADGVDRTSLGVYIGPCFDQDLYQYDEHGVLIRFQSFIAFQRQKAIEMGYEFASVHPALAREEAQQEASATDSMRRAR
jgi:hypothetical protein